MFKGQLCQQHHQLHPRLERLENNRLVSFKNLRIILSNLTGLFSVTAILMLAMTIICILLSEIENAPGFAVAFVASGGLAIAFKVAFPGQRNLNSDMPWSWLP